MTPKQEEALRDYLQEVIVPLIEEVLVKKLGQAMTFAKKELPKREWHGLTDEEIARVVSLAGFAPDWVEAHIALQIVRVLEAKLKEKNGGVV